MVCKGSGYGTIATVNQEKAHIARQFMALKVKKHELDYRFNYFLLNSVVENIKTDARGLIAGIARDAVLKQEIVIPCLNEQTKIGEYFDNLDKMITLHQRKPISHPNHSTTHTKHKGEEKYVRIRVNDRGKIDRTANLRRFPVDIPGRFKN
mgnify:FL=1